MMKPEYLDRLISWDREELESLKGQGASAQDLEEPAFTSLLTETVFKKHRIGLFIGS
jgi:hypothetical protein